METESSARARTARAGKGALTIIFAVILLDLIGLTILSPIVAFIVQRYQGGALAVTMLSVVYAAAQFLAAPVLGRLSDRYGRRPVLLVSIAGSAAGYFLFGIGGALWILLLSRLIDGITAGNVSIASAYIADVTPPQNRARNYGLMGVMFGLGFVIGPALGGVLSGISLEAPAYAAGVLSTAAAVAAWLILPESLPADRRETRSLSWADVNPFASIMNMVRRPGLGTLFLGQAILYFAFNGNNSILPVFLIDKFAVQPLTISTIFVAGGVMNIVVQGPLIDRLVKSFGEKSLATTGFAIQVVCALALYLAPSLWITYPVVMLMTTGAALIWPTMAALIANSVSPEEQGRVSGVSTSLSGLMSVFGPLWAGAAYDHISPGAPYWAAAALFVIVVLVFVRRGGTARMGHPSPATSRDKD